MGMSWKSRLADRVAPELGEEIDVFERQIALRRRGKFDESIFGETRLRRGVYGQRYDNGQRNDGLRTRTLAFPSGDISKGASTLWDAPGMQRIKIPYGGLNPEQLECLAELSEEYSDAICHITTRQDVQLHFIQLDDTPELMRRLAAVGITTREACGNGVRNVTACPLAGTCKTEPFDVTGYADALAAYLLGHEDCQDFGRKFKISFSGCAGEACGLATIHDLGFIAATRDSENSSGELTSEHGFTLYVGGGLGAVPYTAKLYDEFVPAEEVLPLSLAICRVFGRLGEKRNRAKARLKFVVKKLGIDGFRETVAAERASLRHDPRWTSFLRDLDASSETGAAEAYAKVIPASSLRRTPAAESEGYPAFAASNIQPQKQAGYNVVIVSLPLGDASADQMRALADIARRYTPGTLRATVEQNIALRWVRDEDRVALYRDLRAADLATASAGTIIDITACPGTDTCKLGIAASRGLAGELSERLAIKNLSLDEAVRNLRIKISGCFNSCGQHHIADIGFWGVSRKVGGYTVPHFQVVLGGQWSHNAKRYGLAMGAVPSRNIPVAVDRITDLFVAERQRGERFIDFIERVGKKHMRAALEDLFAVPGHDEDPSYYSDWGDPREFSIGDLGIGECAGEVISSAQFGLAASERKVFEAQELLEKGQTAPAAGRAFDAMLEAAKALAKERAPNLGGDSDEIIAAFREHFYDTELFFDPYAKGKFAGYLFTAHAVRVATQDTTGHVESIDSARQRIDEAQLFIEAAHACHGRMD
jgi:sulfite reductase (ferredoxin)